MPDSTWLAALETVNSEQEGMSLLWEHQSDLTDAIAADLAQRARTLRESGDPDGAAEFQSWADHARALVTRRDILATNIHGVEDGAARLRAARDRFDQAFLDVCLEMAAAPFAALQKCIEAGDRAGAEEIVAKVRERVEFEVGFLHAVARFGEKPEIQAHADFADGCWRQLLYGLETLRSNTTQADALRQAARGRLQACAANERGPAGLRSRAENNLATLEYPDLDKVKAHQTAALALAEAAGDRQQARDMRRQLAFWAQKDGDWQRVFALLDQNLKAEEKAVLAEYSPQLAFGIIRDTRTDVKEFVNACLELGKQDPAYWQRALEAVEWGKSRAHLRAAAAVATAYRDIPLRLRHRRDRLQALTRDWGQKLAMLPVDVAEKHKPEAERLLVLLAQVEAQIEKFGKLRLFDLSCFPASYADMVKTVPPGAVVLSFFQQKDRVITFVLGPEGLRGRPEIAPLDSEFIARVSVQVEATSAMRENFESWNQIQINIDQQIEAIYPTGALRALYQALIVPVFDRLQGSNVIYISADATLLKIPLHAALKDATTALIDDFPIAYTPGIAILRRALKRERPSTNLPIFAAGVAADKHGPKCSREEAQTVAQFYGAQPEPATRQALATRGMQSRVLHLSCHTDSTTAMTSDRGLQLEDGAFGNEDIVRGGCQASLVFLSACDTSRSDLLAYGMELIGFVGAFMRTGVPSVVATMWKMSEKVSLPLVEAFYRELVKNQAGPAVALQRAIKAIKSQERFDHPFFWASICLYGAA